MQAIYSLVYICSSIAYISLGLLVYAKNWRSKMNASFFWLCLSITGWVLTLYFFYFLHGDSLLLLGKLNFAFTELVIFFAFYFTYWFPEKSFKLNKLTNVTLFIWLAVLLGITIFTDFIDKNEIIHNGNIITEYGGLYFLFVIHFFVFALAVAILPLLKYAKLSGLHRHQIKYFWIGAVLTLVPASTTNIILPLFFERFDLQCIGPLFAFFFIGLISYAIIAHRLMDIKIVLRRSFVFALSVLAVLFPAFLIRLLLAKAFGLSDLPVNLLADFAILVPTIVAFPKIQRYFFKIANKYFFSSLYDSRKIIAALSVKLQSTLNASEIYDSITQILVDSFHIKSIGFLVYDSKNKTYSVAKNAGFKVDGRKIFGEDQNLHKNYIEEGKCIITEEIKGNQQGNKKLLKILKDLGVEIMVPLNTKNKTLGLIILGAKESSDIYGRKDLEMLKIIGSQAAISLENALLYEQVSKQKDKLDRFNRELQERVNEQTKEIRKKSQVLEKNNIRLKKMLKMRGEFLNIASHQLRTPVAVIKGMADVLSGKEPLTKKEKERFLQGIIIKSNKLAGIVHDILSVTEMDSDKFTLKVEPMDIKPLLERMVKEKQLEAKDKKLKLKLEIANKLPLVLSSERYLEQAIVNLINNALIYTEKGSVTVKATKKKKEVLIRIIDTGIGISAKDTPKLFDKFIRAKNATNTHTDGTGLGLFITKKIIDGHKRAKVWIEKTELGKGTTFTISLPQAKQKS